MLLKNMTCNYVFGLEWEKIFHQVIETADRRSMISHSYKKRSKTLGTQGKGGLSAPAYAQFFLANDHDRLIENFWKRFPSNFEKKNYAKVFDI